MLSSTLTLEDADGGNVVFTTRRNLDWGTERYVPANPSDGTLTISHQLQGKGSNEVFRHLVSRKRTIVDEAGRVHQCTVNLTVAYTNSGVFGDQEIVDMTTQVASLTVDGGLDATTGAAGTTNMTAIINGES